PPDRRKILRRFAALWPRLGRALQSHTALPESGTALGTNRRNNLVKTNEAFTIRPMFILRENRDKNLEPQVALCLRRHGNFRLQPVPGKTGSVAHNRVTSIISRSRLFLSPYCGD